MAGTSLLALIDDIATLLDDVSVMTGVAAKKTAVAAKKTAGVLGDDLALNAQQVTGVRAERELPVVWAVFKGSAVNKAILVPCALLLSAFLPWIITPLLMLGGAFLCYEGFEKVAHKLLHTEAEDEAEHDQLHQPVHPTENQIPGQHHGQQGDPGQQGQFTFEQRGLHGDGFDQGGHLSLIHI